MVKLFVRFSVPKVASAAAALAACAVVGAGVPVAVAADQVASAAASNADGEGVSVASVRDAGGDSFADHPRRATRKERNSVDLRHVRVTSDLDSGRVQVVAHVKDLRPGAGDTQFFSMIFNDTDAAEDAGEAHRWTPSQVTFVRGEGTVEFRHWPDPDGLSKTKVCRDSTVQMMYRKDRVKASFPASCLTGVETSTVQVVATINNYRDDKPWWISVIGDQANLNGPVTFNAPE